MGMDRAELEGLRERVPLLEGVGKKAQEWSQISSLLTKMGQGPVEIVYNFVTSLGV